MQKKVDPQSFKEEVVKYYQTNHTIAETIKKYGIAESTLFEWRKRYDEKHYLSTSSLPRLKHWRQKELHLNKIEKKFYTLIYQARLLCWVGKCSRARVIERSS